MIAKRLILKKFLKQKAKNDDEDWLNYFYNQPGSAPGTLEIEADALPPQISLIDYNLERAVRDEDLAPPQCRQYLETNSVSWVDVSGLGNASVLQKIGDVFDLHPLVLEDIFQIPQRPKVEPYADQLVIITQMVMLKDTEEGFRIEQVSIVLGEHYVLSVQEESHWDCFDPVRDRIQYNKGSIRQHKADYLAYALWDAIIDGYFPVLEDYGERIEALENEVISNPNNATLKKIYQIRRELLALRRSIWPQRDAINVLLRGESKLISPEVLRYFRDCYDHIIQIIDVIETYRELTSGLMDVYLTAVSNRMNEIMKVLTIISTIFIPLTFIVGVYGMNFNPEVSPWNMPALNWYWGYPVVWLIMLTIAGSLVVFFWRKGWFENMSGSD
ncbi:magnesium/cobalt transporter CorA [Spirulina sp. CS-785/01]|uniref:magnesium/cobalt transporter CorA n=1 Tax=Spirulina sp. CS-785/01 TaxID=3021716 RepID=UPI00232BD1CF|nr:magnesium/cobalt transporter CorA [Spirulina sp. CS-785/01]MDB9315670.1 magnesium/cobalt transporter CorA [Spirulina sp. CS-785/01]